jgi:RNA polymerase sigma-70 factor (ECF subfamily)
MTIAPSDDFIRELTAAQPRLFAFAVTLVGNTDAAADVMQETNVTLCRQWQEYAPGTNFMAWACTVARFKVLEYRRAARREAVIFGGELLDDLASEAEEASHSDSDQAAALAECLGKLQPRQRELIRQRYEDGVTVQALAQSEHRSSRGMAVTLFRLRHWLLDCMERALMR